MKKPTTGAIASLILLLAALPSLAQPSEGPQIGSVAPSFLLPDTLGRTVLLSDLGGGIVVLNFWAFWCDTWKREMPSLRELASDQQSDHFRMAAISVDGERLPVFQQSPLRRETPFPVLLDSDRTVTTEYHIHHVPTVVVIDRSGHVRYTAYGYPGNHTLLSEIRRIEAMDDKSGVPTR